ncbi:hypothetical protein [Candidatus Hodgkinia cicadicola]|uniref:hypothetical protein n=1 Tax=Candidatus Hodgkinia cicadicola TaxID=573658 RepID=UPI001788DF2F
MVDNFNIKHSDLIKCIYVFGMFVVVDNMGVGFLSKWRLLCGNMIITSNLQHWPFPTR